MKWFLLSFCNWSWTSRFNICIVYATHTIHVFVHWNSARCALCASRGPAWGRAGGVCGSLASSLVGILMCALFSSFFFLAVRTFFLIIDLFRPRNQSKTHLNIISDSPRCWYYCVKFWNGRYMSQYLQKNWHILGEFFSKKWPKTTFFATNVRIKTRALKFWATPFGCRRFRASL